MPLKIRRDNLATHAVVLSVVGELDLVSHDELDDAVDAAVRNDPTDLVLDLTGLTFCDSTGLGLFVRSHRRMTDCGGRLSLVGVQPQVLKVIKLTGLDAALRICPDVTVALSD